MALLFEELPTVFPFYPSKDLQVRYNVNTDEPCGAYLISPKDALLPFQIRKSATSEPPTTIEILNAEDDSLITDNTNLGTFLRKIALEGSDYITYLGDRIFDFTTNDWLDLPYGFYYVRMEFPNGQEVFSETFKVPLERFSITQPANIPFIKLEWSNSEGDIDPLHYNATEADRLVQAVYLDSNLSHTEPEVEVEGVTNGDNEVIPTWQKVLIRYALKDVVPDFVKLALATIPIHDNIVLTLENNKRSGEIVNVEVGSKPEPNGYFSEVEIRFEQDLALIKRGCDFAMDPDDCPAVPSAGTLALTLVEQPTGIEVSANLPVGFIADIHTSYTNTTGTLTRANVYKSQLAAGVLIPWVDLYGDWVTLRLKTFNCISGYGDITPLSPPLNYHPAVYAWSYAVENDPDFITSGGTITGGMKTALFSMIDSLILAGLWDKCHALWPFTGPNEHSHKYNLKNPNNHILTFPNGGIFAATGCSLSSASTQYIDTNFNLATVAPGTQEVSMAVTVRSRTVANAGLMGAFVSNVARLDMQFDNAGADFYGRVLGNGAILFKAFGANPQSPGTYIVSRRSNVLADFRFDHATVPQTASNTTNNPGNAPALNLTIGKVNNDTALGYLNGSVNVAWVGAGLTPAEMTTLGGIFATFNATLGR